MAITTGKVHDVNILDQIVFESGAFYIVDKGYYDFKRLYLIDQAKAFFVIRAKRNMKFKRLYSRPVDKTTGLKCDQTIRLTGRKSSSAYPDKLRRIKFYSETKRKTYVFLTNNFELDALTITLLYRSQQRLRRSYSSVIPNTTALGPGPARTLGKLGWRGGGLSARIFRDDHLRHERILHDQNRRSTDG